MKPQDSTAFEQAQADAMELLLQQYAVMTTSAVDGASAAAPVTTTVSSSSATTASLMDLLAQSCEEANAMVQEMSYEDVAQQLTHAVAATQESLRHIGAHVHEILDDEEKVQNLCHYTCRTNEQMLLPQPETDAQTGSMAMVAQNEASSAIILADDEEHVRSMLSFAHNMCTIMDTALSTITQDELDLAAQLSLEIAQRLLEAGQSLFMSLGDEERRKAGIERAAHITIEEIPDNDHDADTTRSKEKAQRIRRRNRHTTTGLRTYVEHLLVKTREQAREHPYWAATLTAAGLPFIGLAIPIASLVGLGLVVEKYYPEHASLTVEMFSNFMQMMKLWLLLLKISARQFGVVAKECFRSWYEYASTHGFVATGMELASTCCSVGYVGLSRLYQSALQYTQLS